MVGLRLMVSSWGVVNWSMVNNSMVDRSSMVNWCYGVVNKSSWVGNCSRSSMVDRLNWSIGWGRSVAIHLAICFRLSISIAIHTDKSGSGENLK